jgi:CelD/BcsL family acetyltransferase involved in cellulose biosynthesis
VTVRVLTSLDALREIESAWDDVAGACRASPYVGWDWVYHWWATAGRPYPMRVSTVWDGGEMIGALPLMRVDYGARRLGLRELRFASDMVSISPAYLDLVARPGRERECVDAIYARLLEDREWDRIELSRLCARSPAVPALCRAAAEHGLRVELRPWVWSRYAPLPGSFDEYLAGLTRHRRQRIRSQRRRLEKNHAVSFEPAAEPGQVHRVLDKYLADKCARMERRGRWTQFADPGYRKFMHALAEGLLAKGRLRLWHLDVDGVIGAVAFGIVANDVLYFHNYSYDANLERESVSHVLIGHVIQAAIEREHLKAVDFLFTEYHYKVSYAKARELVVKMTAYRPGLRSLSFEGLGHLSAWPRAIASARRRARPLEVPAADDQESAR